ncbi:MAG: Omp28-related outer membrane protein [Crocinitomicaceae bacterium]|nr:Omp28-related outer membrane protein [Crocinitomicaceae bacterium]MDG1735477.1 Omp28-related outer membrane protein [Crocinitomicaceae bacterium]MDG2506148.1 Omp28-related outer membrane protein [Crocinitomicaceae bacterium]
MKKTFLLFLACCLSHLSFSQTFSDDFESYATGSYLGSSSADWTTWSGTEGGAEDVQITDNNASSGSNSIYFSSTSPNGGPADVVLPFDQVYNSGNFSFEANFYVEAGKGAYFNLQGTLVVAQVWALDCYMLEDGTLKLSNQGTPYINANYPSAQWFNLRVDMDLTSNVWELFIDNVSQGSFSNPTGQIGILDLYPVNPAGQGGNGISGYYVDDISYTHLPANLPGLNGGVSFINQISGISGLSYDVVATARNLGVLEINSFDLTYSYNGADVTENITGLNLVSLDTYEHTFTTQLTPILGNNDLMVTISNVNGVLDDDPTDDSKVIGIDPIVPAAGKVVVGEEATGTWCQWCPRGAVYMDQFAQQYGDYWVGVAVHNGDPMTDAVYDAGIGSMIGGYPSAVVDRGADVDPSAMNADFLDRLLTAPAGVIMNGATWDPVSRELEVSVKSTFSQSVTNAYRLACVLSEDGVTGTDAGYNQSNAYAGGGNGIMGGYESLPSSVPAAQMVYDHVARAIAPSFDGSSIFFPATVNPGESVVSNYSFILPADWNAENMHIIGMLISPNGRIDNAGSTSISEAVSNGYEVGPNLGLINPLDFQIDDVLKVYPNPASTILNVTIALSDSPTNELKVFNYKGEIIQTLDLKENIGNWNYALDISDLAAGIYGVSYTHIGGTVMKRFVVE